MGQNWRSFSSSFKAKVALSALREEHTLGELAAQYGLHPTQIAKWKQQALQSLPELFADKRSHPPDETLIARLYQQIGQLQVELEWLKKKADKYC